jgi:ATP-dependent Clp protease protease subunit
MHPKVATQGQASDIQVNAQEVLAKRQLMMEILSDNTGQSIEKLNKDMDRNFYLTPDQAQEYGLIDKVWIEPRLLFFSSFERFVV